MVLKEVQMKKKL